MSKIGDNPYVGAQPLSAKNPLFGREREVRDLFFLLCKERIVLMYAPSGAGKSSLLEGSGGLLDAMYERFHVWPVTRVNTQPSVPYQNPYVLSALIGFERAAPPEHMRSEDELARLTLREGVMSRWRHPDDPKIILLVFDQFEEIVRLNPTDVDRQREFFRQLGELLSEPTVWALLVMREDYLAAIDPYCRQVPTHLRNRFRLDLLGREAAGEAIAKTAETAGRYWEKEAVERVVADLALIKIQPLHGDPYVVPGQYVEPLQLQVVCRDLWEKLAPDDPSFGIDDLDKIGNVDLALAAYYRRCVREVSSGSIGVERAVRKWFSKELISPGHVRGQVLRGKSESGGLDNALIEKLVAKHLVRAEKRSGATWYELAHDRLVPAVEGCNGIWFQRNLSFLERWAELWVTQARNPDLLQTGGVLRDPRRWAKENPDRVHDNERAFLSQSARENRKVWLRRGLVSVLFVALLVGVILGLEADSQRDQALKNAVTFYSSRADEAITREDWEEAWLYTLASLSVDLSGGHNSPQAVGQLLRFEIYPGTDWQERESIALGSVSRLNDADRILHVSTNSKSKNHTEAILQQYTNNGFNVYRTSMQDGRSSLVGLFTHNFEGSGKFGKSFSGELYCVEVDGKRYYGGGDQIVEEGALSESSSGRVLPVGDSPVIAMRRTAKGVGVLTKDGRLRFADAGSMKWKDEKAEWKVGGDGLIGFDAAEDDVVVIYETREVSKGKIELWSGAPAPASMPRGTYEGIDGESFSAVSILSRESMIVAYGTRSGEIGLIDFSDDDGPRVIARTHLHKNTVVQLDGLGALKSPGDYLVSVSEDGQVRHINMRIRAPGETNDRVIWQVAREPRKSTRTLFEKWQTDSLNELPFNWVPPRFELNDSWPKLLAARSKLFGRDYLYQYRRFEESELIRSQEGNWTWKSPAGEASLTEKRRDPSRVLLVGGGGGDIEIAVPAQSGGWLTINGLAFARVKAVEAGRFVLAQGYLLDMGGNRWRIGSGGEIKPLRLRLTHRMPSGEAVLSAGENAGAFLVPGGDGPLQFRASPASTPGPIGKLHATQVHFIADPWSSPKASHSIHYRKTTVDGPFNTARVNPGQVVTFRTQWDVSVTGEQTKQQNFFLGMDMPEGAFSKCVTSAGGERPIGQRKSGHVQIVFRAPAQPGWYFLTHAMREGDKCVGNASIHATRPDNAVAAILVEESSNDGRAR